MAVHWCQIQFDFHELMNELSNLNQWNAEFETHKLSKQILFVNLHIVSNNEAKMRKRFFKLQVNMSFHLVGDWCLLFHSLRTKLSVQDSLCSNMWGGIPWYGRQFFFCFAVLSCHCWCVTKGSHCLFGLAISIFTNFDATVAISSIVHLAWKFWVC